MSFSWAVAGDEGLAAPGVLVEAHLQHIVPRKAIGLRRALRTSSRVAAIARQAPSLGPQSRNSSFVKRRGKR